MGAERRLRLNRGFSPAAALLALTTAAWADLAPGEMVLENYTLRHHAEGVRVLEITGRNARIRDGAVAEMDTIQGAIFVNNKVFMELTAQSAILHAENTSDSSIRLFGVTGRVYYGGTFRSPRLTISLKNSWWSAHAPVFVRPPIRIEAAELHGPLSIYNIAGETAVVTAEAATARGNRIRIDPRKRTIRLDGRAEYMDRDRTLRQDSLLLKFDPTFSKLVPVQPALRSPQKR
ncbi:hypothetical protein HY522_01295 [bacterium]|nr:hypothetical protein [bacterium]